ncbi:MAG TPA: hypothetical protein VM406_10755 [Noviherbaspirillum sp.]|nr:hypothetical protein [Noviherbaspirillum sp.]
MQFGLHPSPVLNALFQARPYQGCTPEDAWVVMLGSDANYSPEISEHAFFGTIVRYHEDGPGFVKRHKVHHPFLLNEYPFDRRTGGVLFHRNIATLLTLEVAARLSFIELLDVPTIGSRSSTPEAQAAYRRLFSRRHLQRLDDFVHRAQGKLVLLPAGVLQEMLHLHSLYGLFSWAEPLQTRDSLTLPGGARVRRVYHPSSSHFYSSAATVKKEISDWVAQRRSDSA